MEMDEMNKLSGLNVAPGWRHSSNFYKALLLAILVIVWPLDAARGQSAATRLQQHKAPQKATVSYFCPMHPEVKSTKRGKCPKCGMDLRRAYADTGFASSANANPNSTANDGAAERATAEATTTGTSDDSGATRKMVIPDVEVLDQDGNSIHFYSDLIKGKTVAINFIFTNCTTICPPLAATFARVQKEMGDKVGRDVHFISISVDPLTDTPERLKAWGAKFKAGAGWTFVTGDKEEMDKLLNALGASVARREDHSPAVIVGNDLKGVWTRTYGLANPSQIVGLILKVMEGKADESLTNEPSKQ
jgi:cytochrome oxidase Cu insertion factor (SCO1/SenC/PrrC family)